MITFFSKEKRSKIKSLLIGAEDEFTAEHQILNGSIILIGIIYLITVILNYLTGLSFFVIIVNSIVAVLFVFLYYLSRGKKYYKHSIFIFHFSIFCSLTIDWFFAGGIISSMPLYYLTFICYIIFFSNSTFRILLVFIYLLNLIILATIEYYHPEFVTPYPNRELQVSDTAESFVMMVFLLIYIIHSGKRLYIKEKQNTIDIIEQYRNNGEMLKKEYNNRIEQLSLREKDVFKLIIEGNSNQEIAEKLFVEVGTVKSHINKIYKKLGTKGRVETINYASNHIR